MIKLEDEQEREAQEEAVGCYGLNGVQYSPPAHHLTPQKFPISTPSTKKNKKNKKKRRKRYRDSSYELQAKRKKNNKKGNLYG
jgi:hypothetical protein